MLATFVSPRIVQRLISLGYSTARSDCIIAWYSATALCIGAVIIGFAPQIGFMLAGKGSHPFHTSDLRIVIHLAKQSSGWTIFTTEFGVRVSVLALVTSFVLPSQVARLNAIIITVETFSDVIFSPLIWRAWGAGLAIDGVGLGFPWFLVGVTLMVVSIVLGLTNVWLGDTKGEEGVISGTEPTS